MTILGSLHRPQLSREIAAWPHERFVVFAIVDNVKPQRRWVFSPVCRSRPVRRFKIPLWLWRPQGLQRHDRAVEGPGYGSVRSRPRPQGPGAFAYVRGHAGISPNALHDFHSRLLSERYCRLSSRAAAGRRGRATYGVRYSAACLLVSVRPPGIEGSARGPGELPGQAPRPRPRKLTHCTICNTDFDAFAPRFV